MHNYAVDWNFKVKNFQLLLCAIFSSEHNPFFEKRCYLVPSYNNKEMWAAVSRNGM